MTITPNYDVRELSPKIIITDYAGSTQYTYESDTIAASPTKDFNLTDLTLNVAQNGNYGNAVLTIDDNNNLLTDTTLRKGSLIKRQWDVQIYLGKTSATLNRWFYGKIMDASVVRPGTGQQSIILSCVGYGVILKDRITKIVRNQDKAANGIDLDDTDVKTRIDNLIYDMFEDKDHQIDENLPLVTGINASTDVTKICPGCLDIKVANVNEFGNTYAGFISRMTGIANTDWYIDADRELNIRDSQSHDSGFLFTNNLSGLDAQGWSATKIGYITNTVVSWSDSSFDSLYSFIHGFGHFAPGLDISEETTPDAADNLDTAWVAIPITPTKDNIFKVALKLIKTGTPASAHEFRIVGDDGSGKPDPTDIRRTVRITKEFLQALGTTTPTTWDEFPIRPKLEVTPNESLFIVFPIYGSASHTINVDYKSGSGTYYDSTDNVTWTSRTGLMNYRVYDAKRLFTTLENTVVSQTLGEPREKLLPIRGDLEEQSVRQTMIQAGAILGKQRRIYQNVEVTPVTDVIPLASFCRLQDVTTGLDIKAVINGYKIEMHAHNNRIGATSITLTLDELYSI
jgi:hypothetical protein